MQECGGAQGLWSPLLPPPGGGSQRRVLCQGPTPRGRSREERGRPEARRLSVPKAVAASLWGSHVASPHLRPTPASPLSGPQTGQPGPSGQSSWLSCLSAALTMAFIAPHNVCLHFQQGRKEALCVSRDFFFFGLPSDPAFCLQILTREACSPRDPSLASTAQEAGLSGGIPVQVQGERLPKDADPRGVIKTARQLRTAGGADHGLGANRALRRVGSRGASHVQVSFGIWNRGNVS